MYRAVGRVKRSETRRIRPIQQDSGGPFPHRPQRYFSRAYVIRGWLAINIDSPRIRVIH